MEGSARLPERAPRSNPPCPGHPPRSQDFEAAVGALVGAAATDLAGLSPEAAVSTLKQRLAKARETHTRREEMEKQVATARTEIESASAALARAGQAVTALAASASLRSEGSAPGEIAADDLAARARQLAARDALRKALRDRREQLVLAADGLDEAVLRTALATHDPDASDAAIAELAEEDQRLDTEGKETFSSLRDLERQLASLEDGVGAELALQQRRNAEAEIILEARNWAVLSLGAMMIGEAIERQRANRQEPLMTRAGTLFSTLTGGDFTGLGQSFDDHDVPHLIGRRAPGRGIGEEVGVTDMSEGTRTSSTSRCASPISRITPRAPSPRPSSATTSSPRSTTGAPRTALRPSRLSAPRCSRSSSPITAMW